MPNKTVFLIGMPGSGKSTLGKKFSEQFQWDFYDLDAVIVEKNGLSIPEIFQQHGETFFRAEETAVLKDMLNFEAPSIVATGGGAPCFNNNMGLINKSGTSIYLNVPLDELAKRIEAEGREKRPLFSQMPFSDFFIQLQKQWQFRKQFYEKAHFTLEGGAKDPLDIAGILKA